MQRTGRPRQRASAAHEQPVASPSPPPVMHNTRRASMDMKPAADNAAANGKAKGSRGVEEPPKAELLAEQPWEKRLRSFRVRTVSTVGMVSGFVFILYLGHVFTTGLVIAIQVQRSTCALGPVLIRTNPACSVFACRAAS